MLYMKGLLMLSFLVIFSANAEERITQSICKANICDESSYRKISIDEVSANVLKAISDKYASYTVTEAYISESEEEAGEYKLFLKKEKKQLVVYYKSTGELIKEEVK